MAAPAHAPCSTAHASKVIDSLQPSFPLVFPTAEEVLADQQHHHHHHHDHLGFGGGFDPFEHDDEFDIPSVQSEQHRKSDLTMRECTFCDEFVTSFDLHSSVQMVLTVRRLETGKLAASFRYLRGYNYTYHGGIEFTGLNTPRRTTEIDNLLHISDICRDCSSHLQDVVLPSLVESWSQLTAVSLIKAAGLVTESDAKRSRLENGVEKKEEKPIHPFFDIVDLVGIIAQYASPLAETVTYPAPKPDSRKRAAALD